MINTSILYDFTSKSASSDWQVVDDVVMGGRSNGNFQISKEGNGIYSGHVSTENNGGFSSLRHTMKTTDLSHGEYFMLKIKGDGKNYQFRVKDQVSHYYSYKHEFSTTGEWQEIKLKMKDFTPTFRGRTPDLPNFCGEKIEQMTFLISNKTDENFKLEIAEILVE